MIRFWSSLGALTLSAPLVMHKTLKCDSFNPSTLDYLTEPELYVLFI